MQAIGKSQVKLLPGLFKERMQVNRDYLLELDTQCLLQNFSLEAGIILPGLQVVDDPAAAKLHWGWEAPICQLRGHFLGHWLSAAAAYVASEKDEVLKVKMDEIVAHLAHCQSLNGNGWVGSIPEKYFEMLANNQYVWSPQYVMHKTIMGLTAAYEEGGNEQALTVLDQLADWYLRWTEEMLTRNPHAIYSGEEGGMLEAWARLYQLTGEEKYHTLTERYSDPGLFRKLLAGQDGLTNCHANASIPLSHGAARLYEITGEEKWKEITEAFWQEAVEKRGMYATTGQNAGEFWIPPHMQGRHLGDRTQEFCTVYNMVRTASYLYRWTGDSRYGDYIERALYNGFLAQQNRHTGMPTYFLPLRAGAHKKWGTKTRDFWCCHGTMVQAQCLYPELIYMADAEAQRLMVCQYIPSSVETVIVDTKISLVQTAGMKYYNDQAFFDENDHSQTSRWAVNFAVTVEEGKQLELALRMPAWLQGEPELWIEEKKADVKINGRQLLIPVSGKMQIKIYLPAGLSTEALPDMPELAAVLEGPIVLAGLTQGDGGISGDQKHPEQFLTGMNEHTYDTFPWQQSVYQTRHQKDNFRLIPLYDVTDEAYTVYLQIEDQP